MAALGKGTKGRGCTPSLCEIVTAAEYKCSKPHTCINDRLHIGNLYGHPQRPLFTFKNAQVLQRVKSVRRIIELRTRRVNI